MKKIIAILVCVCVLAVSLIACCSTTVEGKEEEICRPQSRFQVVDDFEIDFGWDMHPGDLHMIVDRETGVCYMHLITGQKVNVTVMLDADGKPLIWEGD